jgi:hypothetical protein
MQSRALPSLDNDIFKSNANSNVNIFISNENNVASKSCKIEEIAKADRKKYYLEDYQQIYSRYNWMIISRYTADIISADINYNIKVEWLTKHLQDHN